MELGRIRAVVTTGLVGVAAWGPGRIGPTLRLGPALLRIAGGRLAAALALAGLAGGLASAGAYLAVLALPRQPWVLAAADSYAHYATLVVGLVLALVGGGVFYFTYRSTEIPSANKAFEATKKGLLVLLGRNHLHVVSKAYRVQDDT